MRLDLAEECGRMLRKVTIPLPEIEATINAECVIEGSPSFLAI